MRIGLDSFSLHPLKLSPLEELRYVAEHGFEGIQFGEVSSLGRDAAEVRSIRQAADGMGLYTHVSVGGCNPHLAQQRVNDLASSLRRRIELACACGWHELHGVLGGPKERYELPVAWATQLRDSAEVLRSVALVLRDHGARINIETHGDATTFELVRLAEEVGPDVVGVCLDTANVLLHGEEPLAAARRVAPYCHLTHAKDAIVYPIDTGVRRQTLPAGRGVIDWAALIGVLRSTQPEPNLTIEDHKWLFDAPLFEPKWQESNADATREELLYIVKTAWRTADDIRAGKRREPEDYEKIPYGDEMDERLAAARAHLRAIVSGRQ
jgi:sugar phosphate isomerase/epimerase